MRRNTTVGRVNILNLLLPGCPSKLFPSPETLLDGQAAIKRTIPGKVLGEAVVILCHELTGALVVEDPAVNFRK